MITFRDYCAGAMLAAALAGCAGVAPTQRGDAPPPPEPVQAPVNLGGYNAAFRQGYADGCSSAGAGAARRDERRYKAEMDYMMGWNDGNSVCGKRR
jgi:hypothetical protein